MWFKLLFSVLRRRRGGRGRNNFFKFIILGILTIFLIMIISLYASDNVIINFVIKHETNKVMGKVKDVAGEFTDNITDRYPVEQLDGAPIPYTSGTRGTGVNLLLINDIKTEGYAKELLQLYADSAAGKLSTSSYHLSVEALLGMQYNETRNYPGLPYIVKSYIPFDDKNKKILWGEAYGSLPSSAITLRNINKNVINTAPISGGVPTSDGNKLPYTINGVNKLDGGSVSNGTVASRDVNVFQVNRTYFGDLGGTSPAATINGYNTTMGRKSDPYYLPDSLAYMDNIISGTVSKYGLEKEDAVIVSGVYSGVHNAGPAGMTNVIGYGVDFTTSGLISSIPKKSSANYSTFVIDYAKNMTSSVKSIKTVMDDNSNYLREVSYGNLAPLAAFGLLKDGYYLNDAAYKSLTGGGHYGIDGDSVAAWKSVFGESITKDQLRTKLKSYVKSVTDVYPNYITPGEFIKVYGTADDMYKRDFGSIWKLEDYTSPVYKNKVKGAEPRVLHVVNLVTLGHIANNVSTGSLVYASMLKYAGVDIDVTNPSSYYQDKQDQFVPDSSDFATVIKKLGVSVSNDKIYEMLKWGYDRSGFWYYLGGQAKIVSKANYASHEGFVSYGDYTSSSLYSTKRQYFNMIYATKDGSPPSPSQPDSNLVNYGKYLFDCSSFVASAYNEMVNQKSSKLTSLAAAQLTDKNFLTTVGKDQAKAGDLYVTTQHVFFFVGEYANNNATLSVVESKVESAQVGRQGYVWVLEAPNSNKRVGLRIRAKTGLSNYTHRRFVDFLN